MFFFAKLIFIIALEKLIIYTFKDTITFSTHWLARTASRVGFGVNAHNALMEYAKKKNLQKLIPTTERKNGDLGAPKLRASSD